MSRFLAPLASVLFAFLAWPVFALGRTGVRFVHALPGAGDATLTIEQESRTTAVWRSGYANRTRVRALAPGIVRWSLSSGGSRIAGGSATLGDRTYTAIASPRGARVLVRFFPDATSTPRGRARVRVIHASPELGEPDLRVDGRRVVRGLRYGRATPYLTLSPGRHDLEAVRPGTTDVLLSVKGARLAQDTTTSAIVMGTRGRPARVFTVSDTVERREQGASKVASGGEHVVRRGDSLWAIARDRLGSGATDGEVMEEVHRLWQSNREAIGTGDPDLIFPGTTIRLA